MRSKVRLSAIGAASTLLMLVGVFSASGAALAAQPAQTSPSAIVDTPAQLTEEAQEIVKYVVGAGTADRYFDVEAATADGASPETLAAGEMFNAFASAYFATSPCIP